MNYVPFFLTFKLACLTTIILFIIGIPLAYFLSFSKAKGKVIIESLVMMPIVLPPTVLGFYFLIFLGPKSSVGSFLDSTFGISLAFTFEGILVGSIIYCAPFMISPLINGFRSIPQNLIESALLLNKSRINILRFVLIPTIKKPITNAILLTFAHTIGAFGLILMIGGKMAETKVASIAIYDEMNAMNYAAAHKYALILLVVSFTLILTVNLLTRKKATYFA